MFQVRFHGRGGQGTVTAAELLSVAAFRQGKYAQAFPSFGPERTGAPVAAFCRVDDAPIRTHEPVVTPDAIIVSDPTLLHLPGLCAGAAAGALVIVNSPRPVMLPDVDVHVLAASEIAQRTIGKPLPHAALLGAFAALSRVVTFESLAAAIGARFNGPAREGNLAAAREGFAWEEAVAC